MAKYPLMEGESYPEDIDDNINEKGNENERHDDTENYQKSTKNTENRETDIDDEYENDKAKKRAENKKSEVKTEDSEDDTDENSSDSSENKYLPKLKELKTKLHNATSWGHEKNRILLSGLKGLKQEVQELIKEGNIFPADGEKLLKCFDEEKIAESESKAPSETTNNIGLKPLSTIEKETQQELQNYQKYNNDEKSTDYFNAFFDNFSAYDITKRREIYEYLSEVDSITAFKYILSEGEILYKSLSVPMQKHGNIVNYIKTLENKISKLENKNKEIDEEDSKFITPKVKSQSKDRYDSYEALYSHR